MSADPVICKTTRPWLMVATLLASDLLCLALAAVVSVWGRRLIGGEELVPAMYFQLWPALGLFLAAFAAMKLYPAVPLSPADELRKQTVVSSLVFLGLGTATFLTKEAESYSRAVLLVMWGLSLGLVPAGRGACRLLFAARPWWGNSAVILGGGPVGINIVQTLQRRPEIGIKPAAIIDDHPTREADLLGVPILRQLNRGIKQARRVGIPYAILAMPHLDPRRLERLMAQLGKRFHHVLYIPQLAGFSSLWVSAIDLHGVLGLEVRNRLLDPGRRLLKRLLDLALVLLFSPFLALVLLVAALAIKLESRGPVFFLQQRVGVGGKHFSILKFRTMRRDAEEVLAKALADDPELRREWEQTQKLKNDPRITRVGNLLRKTSLDELPQICNVVLGQMSLVGPRPIVDDEIPKYGKGFTLYQQVYPGITGLWQVSGRNDTTYEERVRLDTYYVRNWSVWLDLHLLYRTVLAVLLCRGAY